LQDTVDYGTLVAKVKKGIETDPVDLIETLASRLAGICLEDPLVSSAEITVHKPHAPIEATFADVGVTIHRTRNPPTQPPEPM
jgi:7,8-dihydroneopterin aldolase/epimerase/oxygenase